jgi:hypothetical protein
MALKNGNSRGGNYEISFRDLEHLPDEWQLFLDDPERGYATDIKKAGGIYGLYSKGRSTARFRIVAGTSDFIKNHIERTAPADFVLAQNYPNPFNPATIIKYTVPDFTRGKNIAETRITIHIYNIKGQQLKTLLDDVANPGYHKIRWDGRNRSGKLVSSGAYFYRISIKDNENRERFSNTRKMVMIK